VREITGQQNAIRGWRLEGEGLNLLCFLSFHNGVFLFEC
jgi:hypothetical protein